MPLFVGGVRDGEWHADEFPEREYLHVKIMQPLKMSYALDEIAVINPDVRQETYRRFRFCGLKRSYVVFGLAGNTPDEVFEALLSGYRP